MIGDDTAILLQVMRIIRHRRKLADFQTTTEYRNAKSNGFQTEHVEHVEHVEQNQRAADSVISFWSHLVDQVDNARAEQWRNDRLEMFRRLRAVRRLETAVAKYHRRHSTPQFIEQSTACTHPLPTINLQGIDTTETEIQTLLATIRDDDRREDVRAECWIVRAEHPSSPAIHVFNRAIKNCQMVSRGIYSNRERMRQSRHGRDIQPTDDDCRKWETQSAATIWRDSIADCNKQERFELACVLVKTQLGRETLDALLAGKSRAEIAAQLGISQATLSRRFAQLELAII
ncbi:MAG: hypothetical protein EBW87_03495 [Burkholderiaceae bacterium]|nr:hypothetical protein [Burkholderiaceae bacterium]